MWSLRTSASCANRFREIGSFVFEFEWEAHGFGGDQDVREDDDRVHAKATEGLHGDFDGEVRRFANFQKRMFCADFAVFGEIAAGLAHHPDGKARHRFAVRGAKEELFAGE